MSSSGSGTTMSCNSRKDPGWKYNYLRDPKDTNSVSCNFCGHVTKEGIFRAKQHQMGGYRNARPCPKCPLEVVEELRSYTKKKIETKAIAIASHVTLPSNECEIGDDIEEDVEEHCSKMKKLKGKMQQNKGPMDLFMMRKTEVGKKRQQSIVDACDKEARDKTIQYIARFFYQAGIAFNAARLDSFKWMLEAVGRYGPNLKPPSFHEMRVTLLKKEVDYTKSLMNDHEESWAQFECSIMSDSWTDRKSRCLINFLVNSSKGTMFLESVDASGYAKTGEKLFELLDNFVEKVGEENVLQVITDNGSNFVLAGKLLQVKRKHVYWTPCAAHCIDLMFEDIRKISSIKKTVENAIFLVGFIYIHGSALNIMRGFTQKKELLRCGVIRFATTFLTLQRLHVLKNNLRRMFRSQEWEDNKLNSTVKGKKAYAIVLRESFWNAILYTLKVMGPLVIVLRLVDNEKKPAMGYIYKAMDKAKETIQKSFNGKEEKYAEIFKIIDRRWDCQLHHPLHAARHFLNLAYVDQNSPILSDSEVTKGLYAAIEKLIPNIKLQDKIIDEISYYKKAEGQFGNRLVIRSRTVKSPAEWWSLFGSDTPNLQKLAIRILSLTCSSSGCERNRSTFEQIHTKKRNRLDHRKLLDLVYIKYNQKLKARFDLRDTIDPMSLDGIDSCNEWLIGEMEEDQNARNDLVFSDDVLTWRDVERTAEVDVPVNNTRYRAGRFASSSTSKMPIEEDEVNYDVDEEIEGYVDEDDDNLNDDGNDG